MPDIPTNNTELYLANIAGESDRAPDFPTNNIERYLAVIAGESDQMPAFPTNKIERYLQKIAANGGGGNVPAALVAAMEITPTTTLTYNNRMTVDLVADVDSIIIVSINDYPSTPDPTNYIAICWAGGILGASNGNGGIGQILRPNGTVGTDVAMCNYTRSTGELKIGGEYGYFFAGTTYSIFQIEVG